jgi:hypothetical protein
MQLAGDLALANLTDQASALARKSWSLALQAAQVDALAPAVMQLNASASQLQELLNRISGKSLRSIDYFDGRKSGPRHRF